MTRFNALKPSSVVGSFKTSALGERVEASKQIVPPQSYYPFETSSGVVGPNFTPDIIAGRNLGWSLPLGGDSNYSIIDDGIIGKAVRLSHPEGTDPSSSSLSNSDSFFNFAQSFQFRVWLRYNGYSLPANRQILNRGNNYTLFASQPSYDPDTGEANFAPWLLRYASRSPTNIFLHPASPLSINEWHHVIFFWDQPNNKVGVYVDGLLDQHTGNAGGPVGLTAMRLASATLDGLAQLDFDELAFWDFGLLGRNVFTQAEVDADFASREPLA